MVVLSNCPGCGAHPNMFVHLDSKVILTLRQISSLPALPMQPHTSKVSSCPSALFCVLPSDLQGTRPSRWNTLARRQVR